MLDLSLREAFAAIEAGFSGTLEYETPRAKYAYYRIGGPAAVIATPRDFASLAKIHEVIQETRAPYFILGWGSNLLFSDEEYAGVVIRMKHLFTEIEALTELNGEPGSYLKLGASLGAASLLKHASEFGYGGLACLTGIPGSIGGMVAMNAGTHLGEIGKRVVQSEFVRFGTDRPLEISTRVHAEDDFSYRQNHFLKPGDLLTHTYLVYEKSTPEAVRREIDELYLRRKNTQPVNFPSCGSVFKNPRNHGLHAWQVVDHLGLRGKQIGHAQISEKHPNFIVNLGSARASDVRELIDLVKSRAASELKIDLETEVKLIP